MSAPIMTRVQWSMGKHKFQEAWYEDTPNDNARIKQFIDETQRSSHPSVRLIVTTYTQTLEEVYEPLSPLPLQEATGNEDVS